MAEDVRRYVEVKLEGDPAKFAGVLEMIASEFRDESNLGSGACEGVAFEIEWDEKDD